MKLVVPKIAALLTLLILGAVSQLPLGCNPGPGALLRAKVIEQPSEVVGGPVSAATVGDFLLENDQIRVAILGSRSSPAPGVYGGSLVDIDRRRPMEGYEGGLGHDRFSEIFPVSNLIVPNPEFTEVKVLTDGSDGQSASVRVEGDGDFLYEALAILEQQDAVLATIFPGVRTKLRFRTDYILKPGARHVLMKTTIFIREDDQASTCLGVGSCNLDCPNGYAQDENGCITCACSEALALDLYDGPKSVFGGILGDTPTVDDPPAIRRAGIVAGDFVFFGNQNNVFAPGVGYDEDDAVQGAANEGRNTFTSPLTYPFVAAAGKDVSYGYFAPGSDGTLSAMNVPIFASAATAFLVGGKQCSFDSADDQACDRHRAFSYERYLVVGDGDIASVTDEMNTIRGVKQGSIEGHVSWAETGEPVPNAEIVVLTDPAPSRSFETIDEIVNENRKLSGTAGVINSIYADLGNDKIEDGSYEAQLAPGSYLLVAMDPSAQALSPPRRVSISAGATVSQPFALPRLATVEYRVSDPSGLRLPAKLSFVALDEGGRAREGDGARRVYAGESRLNNGVRLIDLTTSGEGKVRIEPGRYRLVVSRGPEFAVHEEELVLSPTSTARVDAVLAREVDTTGFVAVDMHLHSAPSFDSGMAVAKRVATVAAEGLDVGVSTDHDVATDYAPFVRELRLEEQLKTFVSAEVTTLEYGHYIGFPIAFDAQDVPRHGAPDWSCYSAGQILEAIRGAGDGMRPLTIVAHPRDGFFGYIDQSGVDTFTLERKLDTLNAANPVFRTVSCDFDAMEAMGAKRLDLLRTPTFGELADWTRCKARLEASKSEADLVASCPEVSKSTLVGCGEMAFPTCKRVNRSRLAHEFTKRILERTEEEQRRAFDFTGTSEDSQSACDVAGLGDLPVPEGERDAPCSFRAGQIDDFFRYLEFGLTPTQIGSSDSHDGLKEPGAPRTYVRSPTDAARAIDVKDLVAELRGGHALATYGPFVTATIDDKTFGETVKAREGQTKRLLLRVQTPSWFGADRVEVYMNGHIVRELSSKKGPRSIEDFRVDVPLKIPKRDSWVVVIASGFGDENLMRPVVLDIPFGEIQLSALASGAFADVPVVNTILTSSPSVPDWSPIIPYAMTNPIFIDVDGNGLYDAPLGPPPFCSRPCDTDESCVTPELCLEEEGVCGLPISGGCSIRRAIPGEE